MAMGGYRLVAGAETGIWSCDFGLKGNTPGRASAATLPELRQNWGRQALTGQQSDSIEWCLSDYYNYVHMIHSRKRCFI